MVQYNGREVPKEGFRVFIYGIEGQKKLVNSWEEFVRHTSTDVWFPNKDDIPPKIILPKLKKVKKKKLPLVEAVRENLTTEGG